MSKGVVDEAVAEEVGVDGTLDFFLSGDPYTPFYFEWVWCTSRGVQSTCAIAGLSSGVLFGVYALVSRFRGFGGGAAISERSSYVLAHTYTLTLFYTLKSNLQGILPLDALP